MSQETAAALGALDLKSIETAPAPRILLVGRPEQPLDALADRVRPLGATVDVLSLPGVETALDAPTEEAVVPIAIVESIVDWIGDAPPTERVGPAIASRRGRDRRHVRDDPRDGDAGRVAHGGPG